MSLVAADLQGLFVDALGSTSMSVRIVEREVKNVGLWLGDSNYCLNISDFANAARS